VKTVEINDDSEFLPAKLKVRDNLRLMDRYKAVDRFDLDYNKVFHHQIKPVADIEPDLSIDKRQRYLGKNLSSLVA
jgi:hypothetical protein